MKEKDIRKKLMEEGFTNIYVWEDAPGTFYPDHTHPGVTAHVVLEGEIAVTSEGKTNTYRKGDRFDVPAGTVHSARVGPSGCRYIIGEK
jgi:quercetin dioxygenase-like cupin family protein